MNIQEVEKKLNKKVKVYFKENDQRTPMIGKFISFKDSKDLAKKGMVRFVSLSKLDAFNEDAPDTCTAMSKIYSVAYFTQIIDV